MYVNPDFAVFFSLIISLQQNVLIVNLLDQATGFSSFYFFEPCKGPTLSCIPGDTHTNPICLSKVQSSPNIKFTFNIVTCSIPHPTK